MCASECQVESGEAEWMPEEMKEHPEDSSHDQHHISVIQLMTMNEDQFSFGNCKSELCCKGIHNS